MANIRKPVNMTEEKKIRSNPFERRARTEYHIDTRYRTEWVNDLSDNVQRMLDAGFVFMDEDDRWGRKKTGNPDEGTPLEKRVAVNVGRAGGQENVTAYLMRMPIPEYEEMMAPERERRKEPMREIMRQKDQMKHDGYYGDINIK